MLRGSYTGGHAIAASDAQCANETQFQSAYLMRSEGGADLEVDAVTVRCAVRGEGALPTYSQRFLKGEQKLASDKYYTLINSLNSACCYKLTVEEVPDAAPNGTVFGRPSVLQSYKMQPGLVNGRGHYVSDGGEWVITFCDPYWYIQEEHKR